jgi:predicted ATP-grasp superfamily ATP-dependent carboligase
LAQVPAGLVSSNAGDPVMRSRYARRKHVFPGDVMTAGTAFCDYLETHLSPGSVLIPTSDVLVQWMASYRARLEKSFCFCIPTDNIVALLLDKARQIETIRRLDVSVPNTTEMTRPLEEIIACLWFPMIVKPTAPQILRDWGEKNRIVDSPAQLRDFVRDHHDLLPGLLAQEIIPGPDSHQWVCNCTFDRSARLAQAFVFQRLSLYPPHRGQTSYARSRSNEEVVALVARIGRKLGYTGPAMMEFKFDARDGRYKYFETNPRLGQCNFFDTQCGINNVHATYLLALGRALPQAMPVQRNDVMFVNLLFDVRGRLLEKQGLASIGRMYLRSLRFPHVGQWRYWLDPLPSLVFNCLLLSHGVRGVRAGWRKSRSRPTVQHRTWSLRGSTP